MYNLLPTHKLPYNLNIGEDKVIFKKKAEIKSYLNNREKIQARTVAKVGWGVPAPSWKCAKAGFLTDKRDFL